MRTTIGLVPTLLLGMLATPILGFAASRCDLDGSWYGAISSGQEILVTHHKGDELKGTSVLEVPGFDPTLGGSFPAAVKTSTFRGVWERIDNRNFAVTFVGYSVDTYGNTIVIGKIRAVETLSEDCNSILVNNVNDIFLPGQDPFDDQPLFSIEAQPHWLYRMRIDVPELPSE